MTNDPASDSLTTVLVAGATVAEGDEDKPGVTLDYDAGGNLVALEVLDASKRVSETDQIHQVTFR